MVANMMISGKKYQIRNVKTLKDNIHTFSIEISLSIEYTMHMTLAFRNSSLNSLSDCSCAIGINFLIKKNSKIEKYT